MLLSPVNASAFHLERLKVKFDDTNQSGFYTCAEHIQFSSVLPGCKYSCSSSFWNCPPRILAPVRNYEDGVFVKYGPKYIVTDDLQVAHATTGLILSMLDRFGLQDQARIEKKILELNNNKVSLSLSLSLNLYATSYRFIFLCNARIHWHIVLFLAGN